MARLALLDEMLELANIYDVRRGQALRLEIRGQINAFTYLTDREFYATYRMSKPTARMFIDEVIPLLPNARNISTKISPETKVLTALSFYACGGYQRGVGQFTQHSLSQPTVCKCIKQVTDAINREEMLYRHIRYPQNRTERDIIKRGFYEKFKIPGVVGCVDGTHVAIIRPMENEERYYNRKQYHSLNVQMICDSELNILSIDASQAGANHDSFVFDQHPIKNHLVALHQANETAWLLGDCGYSQRKWMMVPILHSTPGSPEEYYTNLQMTARNTVERTIGLFKARWRCTLAHRVLHYSPMSAGKIINACAVVHNICNRARTPYLPEVLSEEETRLEALHHIVTDGNSDPNLRRNYELAEGRAQRDALVARLWQERGRLTN